MSEDPNAEKDGVVNSLKEQPNFLAIQYNENLKKDKPQRAGGVYVPPHKLRAMQQKMLEEQDCNSINYQRMMWQLLRKSINGIINKVNISNIQNIVIELFNENILRGRGLLAKAIIKAQMASPNFTHVYAALIAVINTKLPEIGSLILTRVMILFQRSYHRNNKIVCMATTKMIAHLINQRVLTEFAGLQILMMMLMHPTDDSVEIACDFMIQVGQVFSQITPKGSNVVFQRFKSLLHEGQIGQKAQYSIENLFAIRKISFKDHPGVIQELDLVELEDQITHHMDFEELQEGKQTLNVFKADENFVKTQAEWDEIKQQILGQQNIINLKQMKNYEEEVEEYEDEEEEKGIKDLTEQDLINLRRTIYLAIQSTVNFEQCAHKILKMNIAKGYEVELVDMILECCMMERIYQDYYGFLAQRFCKINDLYKELFINAFVKHYNSIFQENGNKIRNLAQIFGHLFFSHSIDWRIFNVVTIRQDSTTAAHRMFLKILFRKMAQHMGIDKLAQEFKNEEMRVYYEGLFPIGHPNDVRFSINYFTSIGLGKLTQQMRQVLALQEEMINEKRNRQEQLRLMKLMEEEEEMLKLEAQEKEKEKKELQRKMKQIEKRKQEKERQKEKERERQRERQRDRQRQRQRGRDRDRTKGYRNVKNQRRKRQVSSSKSSSSSSSSSNSDSESLTPVAKKVVEPKKDRIRSESSQSSDIESSSKEMQSESSEETPIRKRMQRKNRKYSESSDSSSSSSSSAPANYKRRKASRSREKRRYPQRVSKRHRSYSSEDPKQKYNRRRRNY